MGFPIPPWPTRGYPNIVQITDASGAVLTAALKCRWWCAGGYIVDQMGIPHFVADALDGLCDWNDNMVEGNFVITTPATDGFTGPAERWLVDHVDNLGGRYFTQQFHARKAQT